MVNAILGIICIGSLAAFFVMWAKRDEERDRRWGEISRAASIEKEKDAEIYELESEIRNIKWDNDCLQMQCDRQQNKLSSILCPTNNHVWRDGVCVKCGRVKDV